MEPDAKTDQRARQVLDAAMEVHRALGPGFLETVYEEALTIELNLRSIPFVRQHEASVLYKQEKVGKGRIDFVVDSRLNVEIKAVDGLAPVHMAQVISYLKATGLKLGLLINFNSHLLKEGFRRIILT